MTSTQADLQLTYLKQGTEPTGDAADPYNGLDRFGRIQDQRWIGAGIDAERIQYGYTRAGLKLWAGDTPSSSSSSSSSSSPAGFQLDIQYQYDGLTRRTRKITLVGGDVANPSPVDFYYNTAWKCVEERLANQSASRKQFFYRIRGRNDLICRDRYQTGPHWALHNSII